MVQAHDRRDAEAARHDGGVRGHAADVGDEAAELVALEEDHVGGRQIVRHDDELVLFRQRRLDERLRIDRGRQRTSDRARFDRALARHVHVPRTRRAREEEDRGVAVGTDVGRRVHAGDVRHGVVRMRNGEDPAERDRRILVVEICERASVGAPHRAVLVVDAVGHALDPPDLTLGEGRDPDLLPSASVRRERDAGSVG